MVGWIILSSCRITYRHISDESETNSEDNVSEWQNEALSNLISRYEPPDIFSANNVICFLSLFQINYIFSKRIELCQSDEN